MCVFSIFTIFTVFPPTGDSRSCIFPPLTVLDGSESLNSEHMNVIYVTHDSERYFLPHKNIYSHIDPSGNMVVQVNDRN